MTFRLDAFAGSILHVISTDVPTYIGFDIGFIVIFVTEICVDLTGSFTAGIVGVGVADFDAPSANFDGIVDVADVDAGDVANFDAGDVANFDAGDVANFDGIVDVADAGDATIDAPGVGAPDPGATTTGAGTALGFNTSILIGDFPPIVISGIPCVTIVPVPDGFGVESIPFITTLSIVIEDISIVSMKKKINAFREIGSYEMMLYGFDGLNGVSHQGRSHDCDEGLLQGGMCQLWLPQVYLLLHRVMLVQYLQYILSILD